MKPCLSPLSARALLALCLSSAVAFSPLYGWAFGKKNTAHKPPETTQSPRKTAKPAAKQASKQGGKPSANTAALQALFAPARWQLVEKNYPEAITFYKKVTTEVPEQPGGFHGLALAQYGYASYPEALVNVNKALDLDPTVPEFYLTKARILDALGRQEEAVDHYLTFATLAPGDSGFVDAEQRSDELLNQIDTQLNEAQRNYFGGLKYLSMGEPDKALPMLERFQEASPENLNASLLIGLAYKRQGKLEKAAKQFEQLTQKQPQNPVAFFRLGETYRELGNAESARTAWETFLQLVPVSATSSSINQLLAR